MIREQEKKLHEINEQQYRKSQLYIEENKKKIEELKQGDVVTIPANVKHWHGATAKSWFSHIAV